MRVLVLLLLLLGACAGPRADGSALRDAGHILSRTADGLDRSYRWPPPLRVVHCVRHGPHVVCH